MHELFPFPQYDIFSTYVFNCLGNVVNVGEKYSMNERMVFSYGNEMNMNNNRSED